MADPYADFSTPTSGQADPYAAFSSPSAKPAPEPAKPGRAKSALDEIAGSWHNLVNDVKTATAPTPAQPPRRNGPLPKNANLIDKGLHFLAGGDNGTGEVQTNTPGGQAAVAADRVGGDILDLPLSLGRGVAKAINPNLTSQQAQAYTAAALAGAPVVGAIGREVGPSVSVNALLPKASPQVATNALAMDRAGVQPSLAAASQGRGVAAMANTVAENPLAGARVRGNMRNQIAQTATKADEIAGQYGNVRGPQITGENVQSGIDRFANSKAAPGNASAPARATSFAAKADTLYDDAFSSIEAAQKAKMGTQVSQSSVGGQSASRPYSPVTAPATEQTLGALSRRASGEIGDTISDPKFKGLAQAVVNDRGVTTFQDLRNLRTWVRTAQKDPGLRGNLDTASLKSLEGALTSDIQSNAVSLAGPAAAAKLRRVDQYYAAGSQRIQTALQAFDNTNSGESAYSRIVQAAGSTGSADAQKLLSLKRSLRPEEWGDVAANVISDLGKPKAGAAGMGEDFSVSTFLTNYSKMSPRGREVLFGSIGGGGSKAASLRGELDNLAHVAGLLKGVEKGANTSKTAVSGQAVATLGGLVTPHLAGPTAALLATMGVTGEALTNPTFVRWLARNSKVPNSPGAKASAINQMGQIAKQDRRLLPFYEQLTSPRVTLPATMAAEQSTQGQNQP